MIKKHVAAIFEDVAVLRWLRSKSTWKESLALMALLDPAGGAHGFGPCLLQAALAS